MLEQAGRYRIDRELGRGGMGIVYLADDPMLNRKVAIKTIDLTVSDSSQRDFLRRQLLQDARAAAGLSHPNIVGVHDVIEAGDAIYLVMEYIPGETLSERIRRGQRPDPAGSLTIIQEMASALDYTHARGIIHRDIKPANVMIEEPSGRVRIMDFGIARIAGQTMTLPGMILGTVQYMSPEQIKGEPLDGRTDQFSLAVVAYQLLTGHLIFDAQSFATLAYKIVNEAPEPAHVRNPALSQAVSAALAKGMSREPAGRFPNCLSFAGALASASAQPPTAKIETGVPFTAPVPVPATAPAPAAGRKRAIPAWAAAALGCVVAAGGWLLWHTYTSPSASVPSSIPSASSPDQSATPKPLPVAPSKRTKERPKQLAAAPPERAPAKPVVPEKAPPPAADVEEPDEANGSARKNSTPADVAFDSGMKALNAHDYGTAINSFTQTITLRPKSPKAFQFRGMAHLGSNQPRMAEDDFRKAVQLRPNLGWSWFQLGLMMSRQNKDEEALSDFARAQDVAMAHWGAGVVHARQGHPREAIAEFTKAIALNPNLAQPYHGRSLAKKSIGDPSAAADMEKWKELVAKRGGSEANQ